MTIRLYRVSTGFGPKKQFVAGVDVEKGKVTQTAPILRARCMGLTEIAFLDLCRKNAWGVEEVPMTRAAA